MIGANFNEKNFDEQDHSLTINEASDEKWTSIGMPDANVGKEAKAAWLAACKRNTTQCTWNGIILSRYDIEEFIRKTLPGPQEDQTTIEYPSSWRVKWWKGPPYYVPGTNSARYDQDKLDLWVNAEASRQRRYALAGVKKEYEVYTKAWGEAPLSDGFPAFRNATIQELREVIQDLQEHSVHDLSMRPSQRSDGICYYDNARGNWFLSSPGLVEVLHDANAVKHDFKQKLRDLAAATGAIAINTKCLCKPLRRIIEKAHRVYGHKFNKMLDLVRGSLVYDDPASFKKILHALADDPEIELLHVKNRMAKDFDARVNANYRDIICHFTIGDNPHVCELQIHLQIMYSLKLKTGKAAQRRYLEFRDKKYDGL